MQCKIYPHPVGKMNYLIFTLLMMMTAGTVKSAVAQKKEFKKPVAVKKVIHSKKKLKHTDRRPVPKATISNPDAMKEF